MPAARAPRAVCLCLCLVAIAGPASAGPKTTAQAGPPDDLKPMPVDQPAPQPTNGGLCRAPHAPLCQVDPAAVGSECWCPNGKDASGRMRKEAGKVVDH
jgi:hypothetical protein